MRNYHLRTVRRGERHNPFMQVTDRSNSWRIIRAWPNKNGRILAEMEDSDRRRAAGQYFPEAWKALAAFRKEPVGVHHVGHWLIHENGADRRLPRLREVLADPQAELLVHRPGKRGVARVSSESSTHYVKIVEPQRSTGLVVRHRLAVSAFGDTANTSRLIDSSDGVLKWSRVPGRTLFDLGQEWVKASAAYDPWFAAGRAIGTMHHHRCVPEAEGLETDQVGSEPTLTVHGVAEEIAAISAWTTQAAAYGLFREEDLLHAMETVQEALGSCEQPVEGVLHRDLHDKQLLWDGRDIGVIDVDTLAFGERALDIGNVLAHLELRQLQRVLRPVVANVARRGFLEGLGSVEPGGTLPEPVLERVGAWQAASRLRLAGVYVFLPRWRSVAAEFLLRSLSARHVRNEVAASRS